MNTYQVRIAPGCTYKLPMTGRVLKEGDTTVVSEKILNDHRDQFDILKTNPLLRVRVKAGSHHRSGQVRGNQICWVTQAEYDAFGDKFDLLGDDEIQLSRIALPDEAGEKVTYDITSAALALAEEHGVDLSQIQGLGISGRIVKKDIEAVVYNISSKALAYAEENDVDLTKALGNGYGGQIVKPDIEAVIASGDA